MPSKRLGPANDDENEAAYTRDVEYTHEFKRDYRREKKGRYRNSVAAELLVAVELLANDRTMPPHMVDHALSGNWKDHRDGHLRPDLVLIDRKVEPARKRSKDRIRPVLQLVRLGSHSELGL